VKLGDSEVAIESELRSEFPDALVRRQDEVLMGPVRALLDFLEGKEPHVELPLDIRATAFQRMVWQHLRTIPGGRTATYGEIARSLGREKGARAVARACATNPVALIIPCHRVVPAGGGIGGYRWGGKRKQALLDREQDRETPNPSRGSGRKTRGGPGPPRGL
jgi:AraC family transcriptional regulator of adaptative response/methylated-DNA-[protein]-cysteine methyltransferase